MPSLAPYSVLVKTAFEYSGNTGKQPSGTLNEDVQHPVSFQGILSGCRKSLLKHCLTAGSKGSKVWNTFSPTDANHALDVSLRCFQSHQHMLQELPSWSWLATEVVTLLQQYPGGVSYAVILTELSSKWQGSIQVHTFPGCIACCHARDALITVDSSCHFFPSKKTHIHDAEIISPSRPLCRPKTWQDHQAKSGIGSSLPNGFSTLRQLLGKKRGDCCSSAIVEATVMSVEGAKGSPIVLQLMDASTAERLMAMYLHSRFLQQIDGLSLLLKGRQGVPPKHLLISSSAQVENRTGIAREQYLLRDCDNAKVHKACMGNPTSSQLC
jgi:hypothetical protein